MNCNDDSRVELSVELTSKHGTTMYFEHPIYTYPRVIIVNTSKYVRNVESIVEDHLTFNIIENDSMIVNENQLIRTLLRLRRKRE
jgi:hypothetical protein